MGADIAVMVHPDYQYDPSFIPEMIKLITGGNAMQCRFAYEDKRNALLRRYALLKFANIILTKFENSILQMNLTEYHSGFRAYGKKVMQLPLDLNSNNFVFDTEIIAQMKVAGMKIREIPITTRYFAEASMIGLAERTIWIQIIDRYGTISIV